MTFSWLGIRFEISYIFACALTVFIAADRTGIFLPMLTAVILHEAGHILCLALFKCRIRAVRLVVGTLGIEYDGTVSGVKKAAALLAGPAMNILIFAICRLTGYEEASAINLVIAIYNLLPLRGLDGGAVLEDILLGLLTEKTVNIIFVAIAFSAAAVIIGLYFLNADSDGANISLLLFGIYLILPFIIKKIC